MLFNAAHSLSDDARAHVAELLNRALAEEFALSAAARDYHWQVRGPHFLSLHELFDQQYREIDRWIERIGERARSLGVVPRTSWDELISAPRLHPVPGASLSAACMLAELIALHEQMAGWMKPAGEEIADPATAELIAELVEYHETAAWMLGELLEDHQLAQA